MDIINITLESKMKKKPLKRFQKNLILVFEANKAFIVLGLFSDAESKLFFSFQTLSCLSYYYTHSYYSFPLLFSKKSQENPTRAKFIQL